MRASAAFPMATVYCRLRFASALVGDEAPKGHLLGLLESSCVWASSSRARFAAASMP